MDLGLRPRHNTLVQGLYLGLRHGSSVAWSFILGTTVAWTFETVAWTKLKLSDCSMHKLNCSMHKTICSMHKFECSMHNSHTKSVAWANLTKLFFNGFSTVLFSNNYFSTVFDKNQRFLAKIP